VQCTKISPEFEFGNQRSKVKVTTDKKTKKCGIFSGAVLAGASCVVCQFYASGKISACCLYSWLDKTKTANIIKQNWSQFLLVVKAAALKQQISKILSANSTHRS